MDTSVKYIEMCRKAIEIQNLRAMFMVGDYVYFDNRIHIKSAISDGITHAIDGIVWLPRQDDLMYIHSNKSTTHSVREYLNLLNDTGSYLGILNDVETMEQLQLQVLMFDLYHKRWDGHNWIDRNNMVSSPRI